MKWIKLPEDNPTQGMPKEDVFLVYLKGRVALAEYNEEDNTFYTCWDTIPDGWGIWAVPKERENKFTHWMPLPPEPEDYFTEKQEKK